MSDVGYIADNCTLEDVNGATMIYYAINTCWWTHDANDLSVLPNGLPCGPRGEVLLQTEDVHEWLLAARANPLFYGKYAIQAFMAAHHQNCFWSDKMQHHWSFRTWEEYNEVLAQQDIPIELF